MSSISEIVNALNQIMRFKIFNYKNNKIKIINKSKYNELKKKNCSFALCNRLSSKR